MKQLETLFDKGLVWSAAHASHSAPTQIEIADKTAQSSHKNSAAAGSTSAEDKTNLCAHTLCAQFGIPAIDRTLPLQGLPFGALHEFAFQHALQRKKEPSAPLWLLAALLAYSRRRENVRTESMRTNRHVVVWIGRRSWPTPHALETVWGPELWGSELWNSAFRQNNTGNSTAGRGDNIGCEHFLFLDPPSKQKRLWSIRETLRQRCVFAVIADASEFSPQAYRSLQLAAHHGGGLALLIRNSEELSHPSPAYSRWLLSPHRAATAADSDSCRLAAWKIDLLKIRGSVATGTELPLRWHIALTQDLTGEEGTDDASALSLLPEPAVSLSREKRTYSAA